MSRKLFLDSRIAKEDDDRISVSIIGNRDGWVIAYGKPGKRAPLQHVMLIKMRYLPSDYGRAPVSEEFANFWQSVKLP